MTTTEHQHHIHTHVSHSDCPECRADTERGFVDTAIWRYAHVHEYLEWVRPRLAEIQAGNRTPDARVWHRKFRQAMDRRIAAKVPRQLGRKWNDSYLERLSMALGGRGATEAYLRQFAQRGASCLDR